VGAPSPDCKVSIVLQFSTFVLCAIDIEELLWLIQLFDGQSQPFGVSEVHEVFCRPRVNESDSFGSFCNGVNKKSDSHRFPSR
jgi:hypothetical protein